MYVRVFIQNEAGSTQKGRHNEKTLELLRSEHVSRPYPFPSFGEFEKVKLIA